MISHLIALTQASPAAMWGINVIGWSVFTHVFRRTTSRPALAASYMES